MTAANLFALSPFIRFDPFQDPNKKNSTMTETRFPRVLNVFLSFKFCLGQWGVQWVGMPLLCNRWPSIRFHPAIHLSFRKWQLKGREIKQRKILLDTILQHQPLWKHRVMGTSQGVSLIKAKRSKWHTWIQEAQTPRFQVAQNDTMRLKWLRMARMTQSGQMAQEVKIDQFGNKFQFF